MALTEQEKQTLPQIREALDSIKAQHPDWLYVAVRCTWTKDTIGYGFFVRDPGNPTVPYKKPDTKETQNG